MIPLSVPEIAGNEWKYIKECLDTGWVSSAGAFVGQFEQKVADFVGAKYGIACVNGTAALHISLMLSGVGADDYVITPNITFIATLNSIKYCGANPILIDVDPNTWQMDLDVLEKFLEQQTIIKDGQLLLKSNNKAIKAILPVHVLGNICDMERLMTLAEKFQLKVVEDATESLGSTIKGRHTGTFGEMGCFSFNGNKIITTGGGGVIVTDDESLAKKAKHLTTQAKTSPTEYIHDEIGYNYRLVNILAAMGVAQMEQLPGFIEKKKAVDRFYRSSLREIKDIKFQTIDSDVDANCWLCTIQSSKQSELIKYLNANGVQCRPFWMPMNQLEMFKNDIYISNDDQSNFIYKTCLSIPCSSGITQDQMNTVVNTIAELYQTVNHTSNYERI